MPDTANGGVFLSTPRQSRQYAAFGNPLPAIGIRLHAIPPPPAPRFNVGPSPCRVSGRRARFFQVRRSLSANIDWGGRGGSGNRPLVSLLALECPAFIPRPMLETDIGRQSALNGLLRAVNMEQISLLGAKNA